MSEIRVLDVRGLPPCEPMEQILEAIDTLTPGEKLKALISREPIPLFSILQQRGFAYQVITVQEGLCELLIWRAANHQE